MTKARVAVVGALVLSVTVAASVVLVRWTGSDRTPDDLSSRAQPPGPVPR